MSDLPEFKSQFLSEVTTSFLKVRKSLKYESYDLNFSKVIETHDGRKSEKIELLIRSSASRNNVRVRLYVWDDRWVWFDTRKSKKEGWEWQYTIEGRLSGGVTEKELMVALKSFYINFSSYTEDTIAKEANLQWKNLIALGPKEVMLSSKDYK